MNSISNALSFKAINTSVILYAALYALGAFSQGPIQKYGLLSSDGMMMLVMAYYPLILFMAGYVCGRLTDKNGFLNGAMVGVGSVIVSIVGLSIVFGFEALFVDRQFNIIGVLYPLVLPGLGGALAQVWPKK